MNGGMLAKFARISVPPEYRAEAFVIGEPRLTWVSLFYNEFSNAEIYIVGGTVRDAILGKIASDIDLVIRNVPAETLENWLNAHGACEFVGKRFGTFKFAPHGCGDLEPIDIALPRTEEMDEEKSGGRRDMRIATDFRLPIAEDLSRRDFTVNAMAYELHLKRLVDPFLGLSDLYNGIIRAVRSPQRRFEEDATRILRALRLASQLGFGIEEITWRAIEKHVDLLNKTALNEDGKHEYVVPREMIGREFLLGFVAHPIHTLELWQQSGALLRFMPKIAELPESKLEVIKQTLHLLHKRPLLDEHGIFQASPTVLVAALLALSENNVGEHTYHICKNLFFHQFSKEHRAFVDCQDVFWLVDNLSLFEEVDPANMRPSEFEHKFMNPRGCDLLLLIHAVNIAGGKHSVARERMHTARRIQKSLQNFYERAGEGSYLPKLISGHDISAAGVKQGPIYRELIDIIRDAQLTEKIKTPSEAKEMLNRLVEEL
ncbi:MAG: hypothetical protein ABH826_03545 [Patescibacteria group bacterium]